MRSQSKTRRPRPTEGPAGEKRQDHLGFVSRGCDTADTFVHEKCRHRVLATGDGFLTHSYAYPPEWARPKAKPAGCHRAGFCFCPGDHQRRALKQNNLKAVLFRTGGLGYPPAEAVRCVSSAARLMGRLRGTAE